MNDPARKDKKLIDPCPNRRFDEVYEEGVRWLEEQAKQDWWVIQDQDNEWINEQLGEEQKDG